MTREEVRAGLRRLALAAGGLFALAVLASWMFVLAGATGRRGAAAGVGLVGMGLVVVGVGAFLRTQPVRRAPEGVRVVEREERRSAEALCAGLLALGVVFCAVSMGIG